MPGLKENCRTLGRAFEGRDFWTNLVWTAVVGGGGFVIGWIGSRPAFMNIPPSYLPYISAAIAVGLLYAFWFLNYATRLRLELRGLTDLETALDTLSTYFDEGNNIILNKLVANEIDYGEWGAEWRAWQKETEAFIESKFGLRERNVFSNLVIYKKHDLGGISDQHKKDRAMLASQLLKLRKIIIRHSERAAKWRAENT